MQLPRSFTSTKHRSRDGVAVVGAHVTKVLKPPATSTQYPQARLEDDDAATGLGLASEHHWKGLPYQTLKGTCKTIPFRSFQGSGNGAWNPQRHEAVGCVAHFQILSRIFAAVRLQSGWGHLNPDRNRNLNPKPEIWRKYSGREPKPGKARSRARGTALNLRRAQQWVFCYDCGEIEANLLNPKPPREGFAKLQPKL